MRFIYIYIYIKLSQCFHVFQFLLTIKNVFIIIVQINSIFSNFLIKMYIFVAYQLKFFFILLSKPVPVSYLT